MRITYSDHAIDRRLERNISHTEVERVLKHGTESMQEDGILRKVAIVNGRRLRVAFQKIGPKPWTFHVISVLVGS